LQIIDSIDYKYNTYQMIVLLFILFLTYSLAIDVEDIPSPDADPMACGRTDPSFVCSPDGLLSDQVMGWFDVYAKDLREKSAERTCGEGKSGYELGTAWIKNMEFRSGENKESAAQRYATTLHDRWGIGHRDCNNGIMIFVSIGDRQMYISVGAGATSQLSNSDVSSAIDAMKSYLRNNDNDGALRAGTEEIGKDLLSEGLSTDAIIAIVVGSVAFLGILIGSVVYCLRSNTKEVDPEDFQRSGESSSKSKKAYVAKLRTLEKQYKQVKKKKKDPSGSWNQESCPICLEDWSELEEDPDFFREVLACGHEFCQGCLFDWYQKKGSNTKDNLKHHHHDDSSSSMDSAHSSDGGRRCPICRQVDHSTEGEKVTNPNLPSPPPYRESLPYYTRDRWYDEEMRFRMNSLAYIYPYWLTAATIGTWNPRQGFHSCYPTGYSYANDPVIRHHHTPSPSSWSSPSYSSHSTSYGGGSSYGGSGLGSSWGTSSTTYGSSSFGGGGFSSGGFGGGGFSGGGGGGGGGW